MHSFDSTREILEVFYGDLLLVAPRLVISLLIFLIGWGVAVVLRRFAVFILKKIHIESFAERAGLEAFLLKGGVRYTTTTIISQTIFWVSLACAALAALDFSGVTGATDLMTKILGFVPRLLLACTILIFGLTLARFLRATLLAWLNNMNIEGSKIISRIAYATMIALIVGVVLEYLGIAGTLLVDTFLMAFGAFCLAIGISFGLAGRKHAKTILDKTLGKP